MKDYQDKRGRMLSIIADWQHSGMSKKAYCQAKGVKEATFYYWFARSKEDATSMGNFIRIDKTVTKNEVEVIYPNGVRIKIGNDLSLLSQLIHLY